MTTVERLRALAAEAERIADQIEAGEPGNGMAQFFAGAEPTPVTEDNWREHAGGALGTHLEALGYIERRPIINAELTQGGELD